MADAVTALTRLGAFVAEASNIPHHVRDVAARHLFDTAGAWIAGASTTEGQRLTQSQPKNLPEQVGVAAALARLSEVDNIHLASSTTPGGIVIPAAVMMAGSMPDATSDDLLTAIVLGIEAMVRLGKAINGPTVLYRGIWPTYFAAPFGVAAAAARLHRLDSQQTAHALALSLTLASPGVGHHNAVSTSRWFAVSQAAQSGVAAANAAQNGFTSDLGLLDSAYLNGIYGITPDSEAFAGNLGGTFAIESCSFKPWCAARQTMAATQALKEIVAEGLTPEEMTSINVRVPPLHRGMIDHGVVSDDRASYITSAPYHLAIGVLDPVLQFDIAQSQGRPNLAIEAFMRKVTVGADAQLMAYYPSAWPAHVTVSTASQRRERLTLHVPGDPERPLSDAQLERKFCDVTKATPVMLRRIHSACQLAFEPNNQPGTLLRTITSVLCRMSRKRRAR